MTLLPYRSLPKVTDRESRVKRIGYRVAARRIQLGMTQKLLADIISCSRQVIANIESARTEPDEEMLGWLSDALGRSEIWLEWKP